MRWYSRLLFLATLSLSLPMALPAQSDVCQPPEPTVSAEARAAMLQFQSAEREKLEAERRTWEVRMIAVKNAISSTSLRALCIFRIEVVPQPSVKMVAVRAPKELMSAIEDAIRRLDVPQPVPRNVDLMGYVLVASSMPQDTRGMQRIPDVLQPVAAQIKTLLPEGEIYLFETFAVRATEGQRVGLGGGNENTRFDAQVSIREGSPAVVKLTNLTAFGSGARFNTEVDVPVGSQVVVGKATAGSKAVIMVLTAKILD